MDPIAIILFVGLAVIAVVMVYTRTYLNIMGADEKCRTTWKVLDAALVRRGELVASLEAAMAERGGDVSAGQGTRGRDGDAGRGRGRDDAGRGRDDAGYGRGAVEALEQARAAVDAADAAADKIVASQALTQNLREIFAVTERSAALMTNPDLVELMGQIAEAEKDLEQARRAYEEEVRGYNALVTSFPGNKIGGMRYRPRMSVGARSGRGRGDAGRELPWTRF